MVHISQKISRLGNIRNYQTFRPVYDSHDVTPLHTLCRVRCSKDSIECFEVGSPWIHYCLPSSFLVRRVIQAK